MSLTLICVIRQFSSTLYDLRGYRLFAHIAAAFGGFMFAKRANRGAMRQSSLFSKTIKYLWFLFVAVIIEDKVVE